MIKEHKVGDVHVLSVTKERMNAAVSLALKESLVALLPQSKFIDRQRRAWRAGIHSQGHQCQ